MHILFDVDKFENPKANSVLLDAFVSIKKEILKVLSELKEEMAASQSYIVVILKPTEIAIRYDYMEDTLRNKIDSLLGKKLDLVKVGNELLAAGRN